MHEGNRYRPEAYEPQVEEVMETLEEGPEGFYR
jgi:hypothetical protein